MTGRASSSSQPSFSLDRHADAHFVMTVFPNGRVALTTPSKLTTTEHDEVRALVKAWLDGEHEALVISNCVVVIATRVME